MAHCYWHPGLQPKMSKTVKRKIESVVVRRLFQPLAYFPFL